jgi:hypothetical protein
VRWCNRCRSFNSGWPVRCRHCAAGLAGRLCSRNHINPPDRHLAFCGDCGQPLGEAFGGGFSMRPHAVAACLFCVATAAALLLLTAAERLGPGLALVALGVLALGWRAAYLVLPASTQRGIALTIKAGWIVTRLVLRIAGWLVRKARKTGLKGRGRRG